MLAIAVILCLLLISWAIGAPLLKQTGVIEFLLFMIFTVSLILFLSETSSSMRHALPLLALYLLLYACLLLFCFDEEMYLKLSILLFFFNLVLLSAADKTPMAVGLWSCMQASLLIFSMSCTIKWHVSLE